MADISKLVRLQIVLVVLFIFFKAIRPSALNSDSPEQFKTMLLSLPNFFESVIGTLLLTAIGLVLNSKLNAARQVRPQIVYIVAVAAGGVYVVTQELKIHNIGGENVYDQNDVIYSLIGLVSAYLMIIYKKPRIYDEAPK
jgi:uncharacterized membrane protein YadS